MFTLLSEPHAVTKFLLFQEDKNIFIYPGYARKKTTDWCTYVCTWCV